MFEVLFFKVTVFAEGWIVVASAGGTVTYIGALISFEVMLLLERMENES